MDRSKIFELVEAERHFQNKKWNRGDCGDWPDSLLMKLAILAEEFGEVAMALNDNDIDNLRNELVQVMAVACAWIESEY